MRALPWGVQGAARRHHPEDVRLALLAAEFDLGLLAAGEQILLGPKFRHEFPLTRTPLANVIKVYYYQGVIFYLCAQKCKA